MGQFPMSNNKRMLDAILLLTGMFLYTGRSDALNQRPELFRADFIPGALEQGSPLSAQVRSRCRSL